MSWVQHGRQTAANVQAPAKPATPPSPPPLRDAEHGYDWLYERAEDASHAGLPLAEALEAVRDGYSSAAVDRRIAEEGA